MEFGSLMGLNMDVWRVISGLGLLGSGLLFLYRLICLIDLMKVSEEVIETNKKLIYAGLIVFVPLGLGAWIYEFVEKDKKYSLMFLIPFLIVIIPTAYAFIHMLPRATNFNFNYLNW